MVSLMKYKYVPIGFNEVVWMIDTEDTKNIYYQSGLSIHPADKLMFQINQLNKTAWFKRVAVYEEENK